MRCSSTLATRKTPIGVAAPSTTYRDCMTTYNDSGGKPLVTTADVQFDARDVLAGHYDHVPIRVIGA